MNRILGKYEPTLYALLRIVAGFLFIAHGAQKLLGQFGGFRGVPGAVAPMFTQAWLAGIIELVGGTMIMLGFFASWAAFLASGMMAVAYFQAHAPNGFWPLLNRGELAALYSFLFLFIASRGSGRLSVDAALNRNN